MEISSPSPAGLLDRVLTGHRLPLADLRGAARSLTRYRLRPATRPTPFGLMAGVP